MKFLRNLENPTEFIRFKLESIKTVGGTDNVFNQKHRYFVDLELELQN